MIINKWYRTKYNTIYKINRKKDNLHYMLWLYKNGKEYCPTEKEIFEIGDEELNKIYNNIDYLNCSDEIIKRYGFPSSQKRKTYENDIRYNEFFKKNGI